MERIIDREKIDVGLQPQSIASTNVTGRYLHMSESRHLCATLITGAIAAGGSVVLQLMQAKTEAGGDAKVITGAIVTLAAHVDAEAASAALASVANTDVVTVNGVDFTKAASTDTDAREFADAAGLVACVNAYFDNVIASAVTTTVTVRALDGKADVTLAKTENAGTITLATVAGIGMVDIEAADLDVDNGFEYVGARVTTASATVICGVTMLRGTGRFNPEQIGKTYIS